MKQHLVLKIAFSMVLLSVLALTALPSVAVAKLAPGPCAWAGNCPVQFCTGIPSGAPVRQCHEVEPCTQCERSCGVWVVNGQECKASCYNY